MRRAAALVVGLVVAASVVACREYLPTNRFLQIREGALGSQRPVRVRGKFDHAKHKTPLREAGATCLSCHRFDLVLDEASETDAATAEALALRPGRAPCHRCHVESSTRVSRAPGECATCHDDLAPLRPDDHDVAWIRVHGSMARANPTRCENCHSQAKCINCHQARDSIEQVVHERNFRFFHSVEARANPMKCGTCHRQDFCIRCHQKGKLHKGEE